MGYFKTFIFSTKKNNPQSVSVSLVGLFAMSEIVIFPLPLFILNSVLMLPRWTKIHLNSFIFLQELKILLSVLLGWLKAWKHKSKGGALSGEWLPLSGLFHTQKLVTWVMGVGKEKKLIHSVNAKQIWRLTWIYSVSVAHVGGATIVLRRVDPFSTGTEDSGSGLLKRPKILSFPIRESAQKIPGCTQGHFL